MQLLANLIDLDGDCVRSKVAEADAIPLIVQMLGSDIVMLQEQSAHAISGLIFSTRAKHSTGYRGSVLAAGAIPLLARILLQPGTEEMERSAEKTLLALCWEEPETLESEAQLYRTMLAEAGVIPPLVRLIASEKSETKGIALLVFSRLTINADCCRRAAEAGAVPVLAHHIQNGPQERRGRAELALYHISLVHNDTDIRSKVTAAVNAVPPINQGLQSPGSAPEQQGKAAAATQHSLSEDGPGLGTVILSTGASPAVSKLLESSGSEMVAREAGTRAFSEGAASAGSAGTQGDTSATSAIPETTKPVTGPPSQQQPPLPAANRKKLCWSCGAKGARLKKCSGCAVASYCEAACQKADWKAHKGKCAGLKAAATELMP